jgi:peptidoglycan/LPS O-acetylase OafA/YrhL
VTAVDSRVETDPASLSPSFPVLDTLRAVGAMAVLATHTSFWAGAYAGHGIWGTALARLDIGVAIFFVLSGFLLSRPHVARSAYGLRPPPVGRYLWKRALRVLPVYWVAATIALLALPENDGADWGTWLRTITLTDLYVSSQLPAGLSQMWSLATEVAFYAALPLLMVLALPRHRVSRLRMMGFLLLMVVTSVVWIVQVAPRISEERMSLQWLPAYLSWFAAGIAIAWAHVEWQRGGTTARPIAWVFELGRSPGVCWTIALSLFAVASTPLTGPSLLVPATLGEAVTKNLLYALIASAVVLPGVFADPASRYSRWMSWQPLRHLGHISYSIFCIHLVILDGVMRILGYDLFGGHGWTIFLVTAVLSIAASEVLYRVVERPFMGLRAVGPPRWLAAVTTRTKETSTRY